MYVGLASNNFDPSEGTEPNQSGGSAGNTIVVSGANGKVFNKKIDQAPVRAEAGVERADAACVLLALERSHRMAGSD